MELRSCADNRLDCSVQCNFIFRAQELELGRLAAAFALLRLPGMPELAHHRGNLPNFTPSSVDPKTIKVTLSKEKATSDERACSQCNEASRDPLHK